MHNAPDQLAILRLDVGTDRVGPESCFLDERVIEPGKREDDIVAAILQRAAEAEVWVQVTERPERIEDELQWGRWSDGGRLSSNPTLCQWLAEWYLSSSTTGAPS